MNQKIIILFIAIIIFILTYICFYSVDIINKKDNENIECSKFKRSIFSICNSLLGVILYLKIEEKYSYIICCLIWIILFVIAYIDCVTKYIYDFMSKPLVIMGIIYFLITLIKKDITYIEISGLLLAQIIVLLFKKLKFIGAGDVDIFLAIFLVVSKISFLPIVILIFSMGISGIIGIFLLLFKKVDLNYRKPLCPSIAIATYLIFILFQ